MSHNTNLLEQIPLLQPQSRGFSKWIIGVILIVLICVSGGSYLWAKIFDGRIAPNVSIGIIDVGGLTPDDARTLLQKTVDSILNQGFSIQLNNKEKTLALAHLNGSDLTEDVKFDVYKSVDSAFSIRHSTNPVINTLLVLENTLIPKQIPATVTIHESDIQNNIHILFSEDEQPSMNATFIISKTGTEWNVETKEGIQGSELDAQIIITTMKKLLANVKTGTISANIINKYPTVSVAKAQSQIDQVKTILASSPFTLMYKNKEDETQTWQLKDSDIAKILIPSEGDVVAINQPEFQTYLEPIKSTVNIPAQNARFEITNNRVSAFVESQSGVQIDEDQLQRNLLESFQLSSKNPVQIPTRTEEPSLASKDVNGLGMTEVLGVGISSYKGSPTNRKKNIQNGVNLLNGILIPPGATFSLLESLKPFTLENGYLSELVIKGDKIQPEVGGGLCQIGTTTFRAAMNSGFPIVERSNHSLVVSYYNDPSNNKPGTDATIYDPAPDFKFTNDTGHYVLFQAQNLTKTQQLKFSFWGTLDGRKGSYSPPVVSKWIPVSEPQYTETTKLKPGEEKCQDAHIGANASFTYTVKNPDGTETKKVFSSHYRPLPKICLIGIDPTKNSSPEVPMIITEVPPIPIPTP